jgi:ectoine hydroxylase-related dioxygenase (phytanoyl-CoA dioxygenase family)
MKIFQADDYAVDAIVSALLDGDGAVTIKGLFTPEDISEAREIVMRHSESEAPKATHFQGDASRQGRLDLQRRVWNLLAKGGIFARMSTHPVLMDILRGFLGDGFIMGSIAANRILPGGPGQEPHIDYPYWDYYKTDGFPVRIAANFPLNCQVTILLDPFTEMSGATAYVPGTQKVLHYPGDEDRFHDRCERMIGAPGDTVIFFGSVWHCAMPNKGDFDRSAILIQYLPKFVKPMEDMPSALPADVLDGASPALRQLLGFDYPYPQVLDDSDAENAEGRI